jgi:hypothetical protein
VTQRQSNKHSPRVDSELDSDTAAITHGAPVDSRSRADLRQEDPAEDVNARASGEKPGLPAGMTLSDVELRSELAQCLRPSVFPADRDRLVEVAEAEQSPAWVLAVLRQLPAGRRFEVLEEVSEAIGEHGEARRS